MKILLAGINARYTHSNPALRYLREMVADLPHETMLREFSINMPVLHVAEEIRSAHPDVVALSIYIWNARFAADLAALLRLMMPDVVIVAGGPEVSYRAAAWLEEVPAVDIVIEGAGEAAFRELAQNGFPREERIVRRANPPFAGIPFLYRSGFDGLDNRYIYYESSRGCPFSCSYCLSSRGDQATDFRPLDMVCRELDAILERKPRLVKFVDRSFNADPARARAIWKHLIARGAGTTFHCEIHPLLLEEEDFALLSSAPQGLFQFEIGVQSTNARTLGEIGRPVEWNAIKDSLSRLVAMKHIHTHLDLVVGLPYDDLASIGAAIDRVLSLGADHFQLGFLKALHGTELRTRAAEFGLAFEPFSPYEIISNNWLSPDDLALLRRVEQLIESFVNPHGLDALLSQLAEKEGWFSLLKRLDEHCRMSGFDISTKNVKRCETAVRQMQ